MMIHFLIILALLGMCHGKCQPLESLLRIQFTEDTRLENDASGYPCVIRLGERPRNLDERCFERVECERDFENGALTSWRCQPWRGLPTRYRVEYHLMCKNGADGSVYAPEIPPLTEDQGDPPPLPSTANVSCSLRYRVRYKELWTASAYLTGAFIGFSVILFGLMCVIYGGMEAIGLTATLFLLNVLLNATCYEGLNHLDYISDTVVVSLIVARVLCMVGSILGLLIYLENDRLIQGVREFRADLEYGTSPRSSSPSSSGEEKPRSRRRQVGEESREDTTTMAVLSTEEGDSSDPYDGDLDRPEEGDDDDDNKKE